MDSTADIIKRLRAAGLSQSEIHRRTGIPQPRLSRWEAGKAPDSANDALKLAKLDAELQQGLATQPAPAAAPAPHSTATADDERNPSRLVAVVVERERRTQDLGRQARGTDSKV